MQLSSPNGTDANQDTIANSDYQRMSPIILTSRMGLPHRHTNDSRSPSKSPDVVSTKVLPPKSSKTFSFSVDSLLSNNDSDRKSSSSPITDSKSLNGSSTRQIVGDLLNRRFSVDRILEHGLKNSPLTPGYAPPTSSAKSGAGMGHSPETNLNSPSNSPWNHPLSVALPWFQVARSLSPVHSTYTYDFTNIFLKRKIKSDSELNCI